MAWLGRKEAMAYLGIKDPRVFRRIYQRDGLRFSKLPVSCVLRFFKEWLDDYMRRYEVNHPNRIVAEKMFEDLYA